MPDPSDVFLVRGSIQLIEDAVQGDTRSILFTATAGTTQSWTADADYHILGWAFTGNTGNAWGLFLDTSTASAKFGGAANETTLDNVVIGGRSAATGISSMMSGLKIPFLKNAKIYFQNGTAATQSILIYLTRMT